MPSSHRETGFSGKNPSMAEERGSSAGALQPSEEQVLRSLVKFVTEGKKDLTDAQMAELLCSTFPEAYPRCGRDRLIERVAKISPLPCRREAAVDEPATKRQKIDENLNVSGQIEVVRASASDNCADSNGRELVPSKIDECGGDGVNVAIVEDLGGGNELGDGRGGMNNNKPTFRDFVGSRDVISELKNEVILPLHQLKLLRHFALEPLARILLHGPPGCGKTFLGRVVGNEAGLPFYETSGAALTREGVSGILELFYRAHKNAPSIVFIDEIDAVTPNTESSWLCPVKQLMACMDEPINNDTNCESSNGGPGYVLVIGATNRPDALDPALRQWFDREFLIDVPNQYARREMLDNLKHKHKFVVGMGAMTDPRDLIRLTQGFVGRDMVALVKKAGMAAVKRIVDKKASESYKEQKAEVQFKDRCRQPFSDEELENLIITMDDFVYAGRRVPPSVKMEEFSVTPIAKWDDVGGLQSLKLYFERHIVKRIKYPRIYKDFRWDTLLHSCFLYGPSGCGKTLIVEALAKEAGTNFMHIKAPQLVQFGDKSDWMVENIFSYARAHPPCIVFFDQLDVTPSGDEESDTDSDGNFREWPWPDFRKLLLLLERFGFYLEPMEGVYMIGASNRPEIVNHFERIVEDMAGLAYVPLPTPEERGEILKALARERPIDANVDLMALGKDVAYKKFTGADLSSLMIKASEFAIDRPSLSCGGHMTIRDTDFKSALANISPRLSSKQLKTWELHSKKMADYGRKGWWNSDCHM